jgi:hypothetical protein
MRADGTADNVIQNAFASRKRDFVASDSSRETDAISIGGPPGARLSRGRLRGDVGETG